MDATENSCLMKPNEANKDRTALVGFFSCFFNKGAIDEAMKLFPFKITQIKLIWRQARPSAVGPSVRVYFTTKKKGNYGQKPKYNQESLLIAIRQTPLSQRRTL